MLYIYLTIAFLLGFLVRGFKQHKHKFIVVCSATSDKVPLTYEYKLKGQQIKKKPSDVHVIYQVCKCGKEQVIISDGSMDKFIFNEEVYIAKMKEQEMVEEFKKQMGICN